MDKEIVLITSDMQNIAVIEVSHPTRDSESFLEDWQEANEEVGNNYDPNGPSPSTDETTVDLLTAKGYQIKYRDFSEVVDAG